MKSFWDYQNDDNDYNLIWSFSAIYMFCFIFIMSLWAYGVIHIGGHKLDVLGMGELRVGNLLESIIASAVGAAAGSLMFSAILRFIHWIAKTQARIIVTRKCVSDIQYVFNILVWNGGMRTVYLSDTSEGGIRLFLTRGAVITSNRITWHNERYDKTEYGIEFADYDNSPILRIHALPYKGFVEIELNVMYVFPKVKSAVQKDYGLWRRTNCGAMLYVGYKDNIAALPHDGRFIPQYQPNLQKYPTHLGVTSKN